jgi:aminoglycoside phosphotransferase (APT) family kinase protein
MVLRAEEDIQLPENLKRWVEVCGGGRLREARRVIGGQSREAWTIDLDTDRGPSELFLRREVGYGPMSGSVYTIGREAQIYRALEATAVPVAKVVAIHPDGCEVLLERVTGESYFPGIKSPAEREELADEFAEILAGLHRLDPAGLNLPAMVWPKTPEEHATLELDIWEHLHRTKGTVDPLASLGFRWLRANTPARVQKTVVVQGDTGPGNFMFRDGHIVAVTDWELAHLGDPMEDLGWVATRSLLQSFDDLPAWFENYEQRSGIAVDISSLRYWTICGVLRCVVGEGVIAASGDHNPERAMAIGMLNMHRSVLVDLLTQATGVVVERPTIDTDADATARTPLYDIVDETFATTVLPTLGDPMVAHQARAALRVLRHLSLADRVGARLEQQSCDDLVPLLGHPCPSLHEGTVELARRVDEGEFDEPVLLGYFARDTTRQSALTLPMMGRLARVGPPRLTR